MSLWMMRFFRNLQEEEEEGGWEWTKTSTRTVIEFVAEELEKMPSPASLLRL